MGWRRRALALLAAVGSAAARAETAARLGVLADLSGIAAAHHAFGTRSEADARAVIRQMHEPKVHDPGTVHPDQPGFR